MPEVKSFLSKSLQPRIFYQALEVEEVLLTLRLLDYSSNILS